MNDDATELVIARAKHVVSHMQATFPGRREVYVRFDAPGDSRYGVRASYATAGGIELIPTTQHRDAPFIHGRAEPAAFVELKLPAVALSAPDKQRQFVERATAIVLRWAGGWRWRKSG